MIDWVPLADIADERIETLLDSAFGADRRTKTAYRIRAGLAPIPELSMAACDDGALAGLIQCWPVALEGDDGTHHPLVMVGPVAIDPARQRGGLGRALMTRMLEVANARGLDDAMTLIGDPEYYERFFGFTAARTALWRVPGPVERHRLLARGERVPAGAGVLAARLPVAA